MAVAAEELQAPVDDLVFEVGAQYFAIDAAAPGIANPSARSMIAKKAELLGDAAPPPLR